MSLGSCGIANLAILQLGKFSGGGGRASILALQFCLGTCLDHLGRRHELGELWDCQLGNFTAGKDSGRGGKGLKLFEVFTGVNTYTSRGTLEMSDSGSTKCSEEVPVDLALSLD
ncbi:hypothetical protein Tco_0702572 [Tanacetum coccineum]|uniref:Uncharacterized protein n=1 Tax=Tanacetum coccineum TaxID=301880 RepID=A0ABQ4XX00_9ASTR